MFISTTEIITKVSNFKEYLDNLNTEYKNLNTQTQELKKGWKGTKADVFYEYMEQKYLPALTAAISAMEKYANYLDRIPYVYQKMDEDYNAASVEV